MTTSIEELYGIPSDSHGQKQKNNNTQPFKTSGQVNTQDKLIGAKEKFKSLQWQSDLTRNMRANKAVFVLAAPAAGKTNPMVRAFHGNMYEAELNKVNNRAPHYPRVLYVSPRTQLANQVAINDFTLDPNHGVVNIIRWNMGRALTREISPREQTYILEEAYKNYTAVVAGTGGQISMVESPMFKVKPFIAATYNHAEKILQKYGSYINTIIIDELQEYLPKPGKPELIEDKKAKSLMNIIESAMKSKKGLIMATGSVNLNSAKQFVDFLKKTYGRDIIFPSGITDVNRSKLTLIPFTKMRNSVELADLAKDLISANKTNNVIITFAKKEKPINMLSILTTAQLLQRMLPVVNKNFLFTGRRKEEDSLKSFANKEVNSTYNEKPSHEKGLRGDDFREIDDIEELMYYNTDAMMSSTDGEAVHVTKRDPDNLLIQSALRGFGFILGGMEDRQKAIIQKLFMSNKLKVLFATDAIGVGANVLSHNLFLPSLHKFEDGAMGSVNTSSLVQLINRAGRKGYKGGIPYANVYVQEKDMELAQRVLSADSRFSADEINIDFTEKTLIDKLTKIQKFKVLISRIANRS